MSKRNILITTAMIYANGDLHLGHLVENIRADVWKRFQCLQGNDCLFVGGSDCHGTPIMLNAEKQGISPEALIEASRQSQQTDLAAFNISIDSFHLSHSPENKTLADDIFLKLDANDDIEKRHIQQAYDPEKEMFLPDRYIKGECPKCGAKDQYGDNCEVCGATYAPTDLVNAKSTVSDATPVAKISEHLFFKLSKYQDKLREWLDQGKLQNQIVNKLKEWFGDALQPWDISRDAPYFGFEIPNNPGKYFYVWLDAPIAYLASLVNYCKQHPDVKFDDYWQQNSGAEVYHFIGKDIIYFHALFWPAILMGANLRLPSSIFVNGFLTINGEKLSKSRGNFINAKDYLQHLAPDYLRYYLAAKLSTAIEDIDLNFQDFMQRVNSDLIGKFVNIASRCAGFITKKSEGMLADTMDQPELWQQASSHAASIATHFEKLEYSQATRKIMELADIANQYIAEKAPWQLAKEDGKAEQVQQICTTGINLFRLLCVYLKPIIPDTVEKAEAFFNDVPLSWSSTDTPLLNHKINKFKPLLKRIEQEQLDALLP